MKIMRRVNIVVKGEVQGVSYRAYAKHEADKLGVCGWIANRRDGSVFVVAEGDDDMIARFVEWCSKGPPQAKIEFTDVVDEPFKGEFKGFDIRY